MWLIPIYLLQTSARWHFAVYLFYGRIVIDVPGMTRKIISNRCLFQCKLIHIRTNGHTHFASVQYRKRNKREKRRKQREQAMTEKHSFGLYKKIDNFRCVGNRFAFEECQFFSGIRSRCELLSFVAVVVAVVAVFSSRFLSELAVSLFAYICVAHTHT